MQAGVEQVFYFHADANSLGGFIEEPFRYIGTPSSVSLSSTGGLVTSDSADFRFEDVISCRASFTHVSGRPRQTNGPWISRVSSVIEGLDVVGRITADRVVAHAFIEQPAKGGPRKISFAGTRFENLRVDGKPVTITISPVLLPPNGRGFDDRNQDEFITPEIEWSAVWKTAYSQARTLVDTTDTPEWVRRRYAWLTGQNEDDQRNGYALCSLVEKVDGVASGECFGHIINLPDVGRFFLGEVTVFPYAIQVTMLRAELGCTTTGQASAATIRSNGTSYPPI